ncbi:MAG TPA: SDR family NAD(P)-dependent oxidoreductase [Humibacillus sp.]|nr:SDR family NAD(P)-dependent oxidoreductase [Humibacillus sp.]
MGLRGAGSSHGTTEGVLVAGIDGAQQQGGPNGASTPSAARMPHGRPGGRRRRALITGASSGIGRATALQLASEDWDLVLVSRSVAALGDVVDLCAQRRSHALLVVADVGDEDAVGRAFAVAERELGGLDVVIHSAAALAYGRFEDVPSDVFHAATEATISGTVHVARAALRSFRSHGDRGSLIVVGSLLGKIATPFMSTYVTSKWAVHGLVRTLQIEARATPGISISLVSPGGVDTPVYRQAGSYLGVHGRPPPPISSPEQVAAAVVRSIESPRRERSVGPVNPLVVLGFRAIPAVFDSLVTPLMRRGGLSREPVEATPGNVLAPSPSGEMLHGGWTRRTRTSTEQSEGRSSMSTPEDSLTVEREVAAGSDAVWSVLADGWSYATWVVGTASVRAVDDGWPSAGTLIHHSVGMWPLLLHDTTSALESRAPTKLVLEARGWPLGKAHVTVEVHPRGPQSCIVTIREDAVAGPGTLVPKPLRQAVILPRNRESLRRLALLAEGRPQPSTTMGAIDGRRDPGSTGSVPLASSSPTDPALSPDQPTNSA